MSNARPLLTIAIPTYNRALLIEHLLAVLLEQMRGEKRVELLVSDNASTDGTCEVIETYQNRGLAIRYICNETNLGADRNILQCFEEANGQYVWIFSDDDLILPGSLQRILSALTLQLYDIICIRAYPLVDDCVQYKRFKPVADLDMTRAEDFARCVHVYLTFISGIIVNKERVDSVTHRPFDSLLETNLAHLGPFFTALNHHRRSLFIRDPLIAARGNSNVGYALYHVFGINLASIASEWLDSKTVQFAIINGVIRRFFPFWILQTRETQASSVPEDPHLVLRSCFRYNMRYWVFDYPIYALPLPLARLWLLFVRVINKFDAVLGGVLAG
jgi:glycosyltransferase involved in cell wall biosynthesis